MPTDIDPSDPQKEGRGRLKRALFWLAGSALLGSAAVALWNRRTLSTMREADTDVPIPPQSRDDDGIY